MRLESMEKDWLCTESKDAERGTAARQKRQQFGSLAAPAAIEQVCFLHVLECGAVSSQAPAEGMHLEQIQLGDH